MYLCVTFTTKILALIFGPHWTSYSFFMSSLIPFIFHTISLSTSVLWRYIITELLLSCFAERQLPHKTRMQLDSMAVDRTPELFSELAHRRKPYRLCPWLSLWFAPQFIRLLDGGPFTLVG